MKKWPEEITQRCKQLHKAGWSARQIAEDLGPTFTRNAVIGKIHRLNLTKKVINPRGSKTMLESKPKTKKREVVRQPPTPLKPVEPLKEAKPVPFMDANANHCRAIVGHDGKLVLFCGKQVNKKLVRGHLESESWCPEHRKIYFNLSARR